VLPDLPFPARSGNHLRDLQTLALLEGLGYDVVAVAGVRGPAAGRSLGPAGRLLEGFAVADESQAFVPRLRRALRLLRAGLGSRPGPWALVYEDARLSARTAAALDEQRPALLATRLSFAHLAGLARARSVAVLLDAHDSEVLLAETVHVHARGAARLGGALRVRAARRVERASVAATEVWAPTTRDAKQLRSTAPTARVLVVANGVPVPPALPPRGPREGCEMLLVAGFGYPPNAEAAERLVDRILPLLRRRVPGATVTLVGRDLPDVLVRRWRDRPVRYLGVVDDLAPVYARAAAVVLPLFDHTTAGSPLKVVEAIAHGVPVVVTPVVAERSGTTPGEHVLVGRTDDELAAAVAEATRAGSAVAERAHAWALAHVSPAALLAEVRRESALA
jgi:glycosyltransferase involved in cell wall biosynthesis